MASQSRLRLALLLTAGLLLAACKENGVTAYRVPKDRGSPAPAASAPAAASNTNDLPPDARDAPTSGPSLGGGRPPGPPAVPAPVGSAEAGGMMASTPISTASSQPLVWTAPTGWIPKAVSSMRKGSYAINGPEGAGDLSITAFPGDVGGTLANVNRWRGQLQLPPVPDLTDAVQHLDANGLQMLVFEGASNGTRMLGVIVPRPGETWFFKLTGPDALVARERPAFLDFLRSVRTP